MLARSLQSSIAPFAVACLAIAIFSVMDTIMKGLSIAIGAYNAMFWRTIAGLILTTPLFLFTMRTRPSRATLWLHLWRGLAAAISVLLFFWGLARTPLAEGIALSFIAPLIALGLASMFLKERIGGRAVAGSLLAFAGVLIIVAARAGQDSGQDAIAGAIAILIAAVFYAINLVITRAQSQAAGPMEVAFFFNLIAFALYATAGPWFAHVPSVDHVIPLVAAAISSSISLMLLAWAYRRAEAQYLVSVEYTGFIWAALLGWLVFGEALAPATVAGAALIVAGCLWVARAKPQPPGSAAESGAESAAAGT